MLWRMADAYVIDAVRSPIGRRNGSLSEIRADELAAQVLNGLVGRVDVDPGDIEDVQMGCVTQVGEQALNVGRGAVLVAGWPETVAATTVDRQCGSSLQTAFNAASTVQAGHLDLVVAAGVEHMTRVPMGSNLGDLGWGAVNEKIGERWPIVPQGISAEVIAKEWGLSREALDEYSLESHRRAVAASDEGTFDDEIIPVEVGAAGAAVLFAVDARSYALCALLVTIAVLAAGAVESLTGRAPNLPGPVLWTRLVPSPKASQPADASYLRQLTEHVAHDVGSDAAALSALFPAFFGFVGQLPVEPYALTGSVGLIAIVIGVALLVATTAVYFLGRNRMRASSEGFSSISGHGN